MNNSAAVIKGRENDSQDESGGRKKRLGLKWRKYMSPSAFEARDSRSKRLIMKLHYPLIVSYSLH